MKTQHNANAFLRLNVCVCVNRTCKRGFPDCIIEWIGEGNRLIVSLLCYEDKKICLDCDIVII